MTKRIEVVFTKDLPGVARSGDQRAVAGGFWRNFLLPRGLAVPAGVRQTRRLTKQRQELAVQEGVDVKKVQAGMQQAEKEREKQKEARAARKQEKKTREVKKAAILKSKEA